MPAPPMPTKCSLRPDQGWSIPVTLGRLPDESRIDRVAHEAFGYRRAATRAARGDRVRPRGTRRAGGHVDRLGQVSDLPDRRAADAGRDRRRLPLDRAPARPGRVAQRGRRGRCRAAELDDQRRRARTCAARTGRGDARVPVPGARAARAPGGPGRAERRRHLAVRGRRGPLHLGVGTRLPAGVPAARRGDRGARPPARARPDRDGGAAGARRDRRAARAALAGRADPRVRPPEPALLGRALPRRARRRPQAAGAGGADRGLTGTGDRVRLDAARVRVAGRRGARTPPPITRG